MSAAATAAGYLYASGRLRGRNSRDEQEHGAEHPQRKKIKVEVYSPELEAEKPAAAPARPKKTPKIEYRTRRWRPTDHE
ncbi:MAG TPA: hypothetical protein VHL85_06445 [Burkholderiales bacterium]|jgi:hypothetical protein|nr:hypothetical protein [Burkholderiales bacterium]